MEPSTIYQRPPNTDPSDGAELWIRDPLATPADGKVSLTNFRKWVNKKNVVKANNIADLRLITGVSGDIAIVGGYYTLGDGGGGPERYWDAVSTATDNGASVVKPTEIGIADPGRWIWKDISIIDVRWCGAKGDGTTDDSAAFAVAFSLGSCVAESGTYAINPQTISASCGVFFGSRVRIIPKTTVVNDILFNITANDCAFVCEGQIDGLDRPIVLIQVAGDRNKLYLSDIRNVKTTSLSWAYLSGLIITGDDNEIPVCMGRNFLNTDNPNMSGARLITIQGGAVNTRLGFVKGEDCNDVLAFGTSGLTYAEEISGINIVDNVVYHGYGPLIVNKIKCHNFSTGIGDEIVITGSELHCGSIEVIGKFNSALGIENATLVVIGEISVSSDDSLDCGTIFSARSGNTSAGKIIINRIYGSFAGDNLLGFFNGTCDELTISDIDVKFYATSTAIGSKTSWAKFIGVKKLDIGRINVDIISLITADADIYLLSLPVPATAVCKIGQVDVKILRDDGTAGTHYFRGAGFAQALVFFDGGRWENGVGPYIREMSHSEKNTSDVIPTLGTWRKGTRLNKTPPTAYGVQTIGYVCTASGSPGSWLSITATLA